MDISALNAPATPPYDYQNHSSLHHETNNDKTYHSQNLFFDSPDHAVSSSNSNISDNETVTSHGTTFRRVSPISMPSPPELLNDSSEDEEDLNSPPTTMSSYTTTTHSVYNRRKSVPHRSPSTLTDHKSIVFQLNNDCTPKILGDDRGLLWSLRQRVSMARHHPPSSSSSLPMHKNRLSASRPERRVRAMRIQIPRPHWSKEMYDDHPLVSPMWSNSNHTIAAATTTTNTRPIMFVPNMSTTTKKPSVVKDPMSKFFHTTLDHQPRKKSSSSSSSTTVPVASRRKTSHASSGRPSRVKGPCQACHETSDGCMRKAFDWPFPTSTIFNDKGKPFVYLCNKCGLRYNKSGGCVCRHCRWVLCKEEKRKAMQLIDQMRRTRPEGRIDPDEDIENFICTPKYWNCGHPWKVGWVLHSQHDEDDEDIDTMTEHHSPSLSEATL